MWCPPGVGPGLLGGYPLRLWILIGAALEAQLPGQALGLGKALFILGMAVFLWRLFIGGGRTR